VASTSLIEDQLKDVHTRIANACAKAKRSASEVTLVAVTKYAPPEQIRELISLGVADLGENRVQQLAQRAAQINEYHARKLAAKDESMPPKLRWHMIGHVQRNKVKQLVPATSLIHSVDSLRLAEELDEAGEKLGRKIPFLLQINASEEGQKSGVAVGAAVPLAEQIDTMEHVQLMGIMTMAAIDANESQLHQTFARTREIFEEMKFKKIGKQHFRHLSMGMTNDFEIAIEHGATLLRIGSAIFGAPPADAEKDED
jgi:PLP dependent protein